MRCEIGLDPNVRCRRSRISREIVGRSKTPLLARGVEPGTFLIEGPGTYHYTIAAHAVRGANAAFVGGVRALPHAKASAKAQFLLHFYAAIICMILPYFLDFSHEAL